MTERPILFSGPMVRALLDGRKTQTRRVIKLPTRTRDGHAIYERPDMGGWEATTVGGGSAFRVGKGGERIPVPEAPGIWHRTCAVCISAPYDVGDRLWVRETFDWDGDDPNTIHYHATHDKDFDCFIKKWRPSIHMPRWASRILLEITAVRVERLQDISEEDAEAEGVLAFHSQSPGLEARPYYRSMQSNRGLFEQLWGSINGDESWAANPWVWAITFKRLTP